MTSTTTAPSLALPAASSAMPEYFRYHGLWSPGVRLMRNIGFKAKAVIIAATFLLPLAWVGWQYLSAKNAAIEFSAKERVGVVYARSVLPVLEHTLRDRLGHVKSMYGITPTEAPAELQTRWSALEKTQAEVGEELQTKDRYAALKDAYRGSIPTGSPEQVIEAFDRRVDALQGLLGQSNDASNLTLDPDIDTYYLMEVAVLRLPEMTAAAAKVRSLGLLMLAGKVQGPEWSRKVVEALVLVRMHAAGVEAGLAKAATYNPDVKTRVDATAALASLKTFNDAVEAQVLRAEGPQGDVAAHIARSSAALKDLFALADTTSQALDDLLAARVAGMERDRAISLAALVIGLASALYLFICFRKVLEGGLREVAKHIHAMRDGNLTTTPRPWGCDEVAGLMLTLSEMQASLRRIVTQVRTASDNIVSASAQIAGGAVDLSSRTEQSAARLQETSSAMEQITATVNNNEAALQEVTRLALSNAEIAERGSRIVGQVVDTMHKINSSSGRIGDIVGTIDSIAFQTNILALNAAVEAARAGEQGRGFAVVASEVRALAQRSSAAAREIKQLITASVSQVESGTRVVKDAGATIGEIVGTAHRVRDLLTEVANGTREQNLGVAQSAKAVQALDATTQQNAALVEQTAAAAGTLRDQAQALAQEVSSFKL